MPNIALVTGASSGFGRMITEALAASGHTVYATMRDINGRNAKMAAELAALARERNVAIRCLELDVQNDCSVEQAIARIVADQGRLDVLVHNAGHMVYGPTEAFTPAQLAELYDINVLGTQRVNRAALPHMRRQERGLLVWIGSTSVVGGIPPLLAPYFAAKAGMDALAVSYARELAPLGIETSIVVPGAFTQGTNHFAHAGAPSDSERADAYAAAWPDGFAMRMRDALAATVPTDADPRTVAAAVARIVDAPFGSQPFRVLVDPADDGATASYAMVDRVREQFLQRIGFENLLRPKKA